MAFEAQILLEALHTASIIPFGNEPTFYAMKAFGTFDMIVPTLLAITGALLGQSFNLLIGRLAHRFFHTRLRGEGLDKISASFHRFGFLLLAVCWLPLGNLLITLPAGFFHIPLKKALPVILIGLALHYLAV